MSKPNFITIYAITLLSATIMPIQAQLHIVPLTRDNVTGVKQVVADAWNDVFSQNHTVADWESDGHFKLIDNFETDFITFLILLDGDTVVGCGGIRQLATDTCELKRMWFLRPYRGLGWGTKMLIQLLQVSREHNFKYMRLEVWEPSKQKQAVAFYRKFGFYEISPYCESSPGALFMEKDLTRL